MAWAAIALIVIGVGLAILLLVNFGDGKHTDQLAAVQTAGTIVVGTGGAAALWLTARRQQATEIALNQAKDAHALQEQVAAHARAHQERVAATTEADAQARRITDLYTKAADQIGSDKAPVRLAGLYALRRVAQDNLDQRQTIVDVISAYLRMPYTAPATERPADDASDAEHARFEARAQERQVRLTAQRILATHLNPGDVDQPNVTFWSGIDIDLTGATLIDLDFSDCHLHDAQFTGAEFIGAALFEGTQFDGSARFNGARFTGAARVTEARFEGGVTFSHARFGGRANFNGAEFMSGDYLDPIDFRGAEFGGFAEFSYATFDIRADFELARFAGGTRFKDASVRLGTVDGVWPPGWAVVPSLGRDGWGAFISHQPEAESP